ncbi:universal stress protein [Natranaeroarchaeum sulfidigenes]|uniref:universal stress protein n=1 Tax=Natranaeroarchaeum sulfidigenes TaxID=2784880 RepID=UPI001EE5B64A|nr:universal stress protein [Natranaeroarchaeum sulfidigenes]
MYRRILLPTDGSEGSHRAIEHAVALADDVGADIHTVYVLNATEFDELDGDAVDKRKHVGESALDAVERACDRVGIDVDRELRRGVPHEEILATAEESGSDAVVMGTHGRTGIDRLLVGSVTERVIRESPIPVTTVRVAEENLAIDTPDRALERAKEAVAEAGYEEMDVLDKPYRGTSFWIVPMELEGQKARVHIDGSNGSIRIASSDS